MTDQRVFYGRGKLGSDRIHRLGELPGWVWNTDAAQWEEGFGYLLRFAEREGHPRVPAKHVEDGYKLGIWVNNQRAFTAKARWVLTGFVGLGNYRAGHGTQGPISGRKDSTTCCVSSNAKATPAYRTALWKMAIG